MDQSRHNEFKKSIGPQLKIVYKISYLYCSSAPEREDLQQEILLQLWRSYGSYSPTYKFSTWVYRVALNVAISYSRKLASVKIKANSLDESIIIFDESDDHQAEIELRIEQLYQYIGDLDQVNKAIIILHLEGNSHNEIAEITGLSVSNVGTRMGRIKSILKEKFEVK